MSGSGISKDTMDATDVMFHLDGVAHSIPLPLFPPEDLNSRVSELLRATRSFLDIDLDWISSNIEDLQQQISVYDTLLDRIDEIRSKVQSHLDEVQSDVLQSVFRKMHISQWQNAGKAKQKDGEVLDFSQAPWVLSRVCFHFRSLHLMDMPDRHSSPRHTIDALKAIIHRSEQHPLDIVFKLDPDGDGDMAVEALSVIAKESYWWKTLQLCTFLRLLEWLKVVRGKIPSLESFTLTALDMSGIDRANVSEVSSLKLLVFKG
ncbi:uncharacterized protein EV420DRAFT_1646757 [Desarmillaria tabescens]|uniref:Uncharacterized protein n=1 Tax=Armillaria tabescens TaxID=1929756 RepID=A0AA39JXQ6_ARMTA|nr:uncharacterized protein EV420DRAFT_1646757 [Desarmillaria tabescens]KAK0449760.1 hypothetical protein EV420DRAFT_1646757 [Desarmillaria tabescens]